MNMDIKEKASRGMDLKGLLIIDAHTHMEVPRTAPSVGDPSAKGLVKLMDRLGISAGLNSAMMAVGPDFSIGNDTVYRAMTDYPGRFYGMCVVNPNYPEEIAPELDKRFAQGFTGVKIHPYGHNYFANGENYHILYDYLNRRGGIMISHTYMNEDIGNRICSPELFFEVAKKYRNMTLIMGHTGGAPWGHLECIKLANKYDNVYLELCSTEAFSSYWLKRVVDGVGDERVLFGSDMPFHDPRTALGEVLFSKLPDSSKEKILGLNAERLLKKHKAKKPAGKKR
jgi:uncharacterized protein